MVLTNQLDYSVIFFQIICASQKVQTLINPVYNGYSKFHFFLFQGSSRFAQSSNELPGHASEAAGTAATSGTASSTGSGTLAAGTGDIDVAGHASGAATATGSGSGAGAGAGNVAVNLGN